ncbi:MAG: TraV family lipoprotein [Betaproteobacteria bacterium]|nr:TraV family lipoprotein [Betaproteobacteria bacterium]
MNRAAVAPALLFVLALSGCASTLSGVGGAGGYACKAPEGALCTSVSGVYANSVPGMPKPAKPPEKKSPPAAPAIYGATSIAPGIPAAVSGNSIRSNPRVLRLWIAPWEDADGDLHEEALVHVVVDTGRWLIEHVRPASRFRVDGVAPPVSPNQDSSAAKGSSETTQAPTRFPLPPAGVSSGSEPAATER